MTAQRELALQSFGERVAAEINRQAGRMVLGERGAAIIDEMHAKECPAKAKRTSGKRDPLFDAIATACGWDLATITKAGAGRIARAKAELIEVCPALTPEEIAARAERYKRKHPQAAVTPTAISAHWADLGGGPRTAAAKRDPYIEPAAWRESAANLFPDASDWGKPHDWDSIAWSDIDLTLRQKILAELG